MPNQNIVILPSTTPQPVTGSLILNFNEFINSFGTDQVLVLINGVITKRQYNDVAGLYMWNLNLGDVVQVSIFSSPVSTYRKIWNVNRVDYTTQNVDSNLGIINTFITSGVSGANPASFTFTVAKDALSYNFEYVLDISTDNLPTPTPSPTPTSTPGGPTPTPTPTATPTATPTVTGYTDGFTILVNDSAPSYPGTGTTWTSIATGTTYNATMVNGPIWTGGTPGYFTFDGTNDYGDFGLSSTGATTGSCTFGAWFKTTTSATQKVMAMRGWDFSGNGWSLFISKQTNNKMGVGVVTSLPLAGTEVNSTTTLVNNTWYYVYGVWTRNKFKIYVNGLLENTTSVTGTGLRTSGVGWTLGRGNGNFGDGSISEFITYNRVLTDAEILNNFNLNKTKYGY